MVRVKNRRRPSRRAGGFGVSAGVLGLCGLFALQFIDIGALQTPVEPAASAQVQAPLRATSRADIDLWYRSQAMSLGRFGDGAFAPVVSAALREPEPLGLAVAPPPTSSEPQGEETPQPPAAIGASTPMPPMRPRALDQRTIAQRAPDARPVAATPALQEQGFSFSRIFGGILKPAEPQTDAPSVMAYAPAPGALPNAIPSTPAPSGLALPSAGEKTAVYDISARVVYMPNGERLEAHSGLGPLMDDPRYVHTKMRGATPPNVYNLELRKGLFHGVQAVRMLPTDNRRMYGRNGILVHSYLLGPRGDSNGCVSVANYNAFLQAFVRGEVRRMIVIDGSSTRLALR